MVVVFGWGSGPVEDRGEVVPVRCPNCHNDVVLHEIHSTKRISLYFVPVMPYGANEYLACPVCGHGMHIGPEHVTAVTAMRVATTTFRAGGMPEADYRARIDAFWPSMGITLSAGPHAGAAGAASQAVREASIADRLATLGRLHADGILTDDEFAAAKRHLLER